MTDSVQALQNAMRNRGTSGHYDQPSALDKLRKKAENGCEDARARVHMLESIMARLDQ